MSEPGRNRRECILTRNSPFDFIFRWNEALHNCSATYGCPVTRFIENIPEACMVSDTPGENHHDRKNKLYLFKILKF